MRRVIWLSAGAAFLLAASVTIGSDALIWYDVKDLGVCVWEYTYDVQNVAVEEGIKEFTIWFDFGLYTSMVVRTPDPPAGAWNEIVVEPDVYLQDGGFYDALALALPISIGEHVCDFSVMFTWVGDGKPGSQFYEIVDSTTFETIDSGWTQPIPEPGTMILLGCGIIFVRSNFRRKTQ